MPAPNHSSSTPEQSNHSQPNQSAAPHSHRPRPGRPVPHSTYRLQVNAEQDFAAVAGLVEYVAALGVSHLYLSPILAAAPGSAHGYDVLDHSRVSPDAGGEEAFAALVERAHAAGLGIIADVVPNHMTVPTPVRLNTQLWSVLKEGPASPFADWFDVTWPEQTEPGKYVAGGPRAMLMPVLGDRIGAVLARGELTLDTAGAEPVLRYFEHEFPVREGTEQLALAELVDRQWYRLAYWKVSDDELNYRRFFDVGTLVAVRVEDPDVFDATHATLLQLVRAGAVDGFRIDHPDGLADPRGYLRRLADRDHGTDGAWVVVEKILEGDESLPDDWACAGTTGYDAMLRVGGLFVHPGGAHPLMSTWAQFAGRDGDPVAATMHEVVAESKREVVDTSLFTEVQRLVELLHGICTSDVRLRDHTRRAFSQVVTALLVSFDRYRAYIVPGEVPSPTDTEVLDAAVARARGTLPDDVHDTLDVVRELLLGREAGSAGRIDEAARAELVVRFQQTCGPVMAKGIEDTAFYRWFRLAGLNEVGGDPDVFGIPPETFHRFCTHLRRSWPLSMTTLSTHDTKRAEDTRARLFVLSEVPGRWDEVVGALSSLVSGARSPRVDGATEYLLWQTLFATWDDVRDEPISAERLSQYLTKAMREAKLRTWWTNVSAGYEESVQSFAEHARQDPGVHALIAEFHCEVAPFVRANVLGQKLLQLTMPGVPDVYQGTELVETSLVDPDNRRSVDFAERVALLASLDQGQAPDSVHTAKLLVTSRALRLRRQHPEWFVGPAASYTPLPTTTGHLVAFGRGDEHEIGVVTLATRLAASVAELGGWGSHTVALPTGQWVDVLTGHRFTGGSTPVSVADLLQELPVALLVRL